MLAGGPSSDQSRLTVTPMYSTDLLRLRDFGHLRLPITHGSLNGYQTHSLANDDKSKGSILAEFEVLASLFE